MLLALVLAVTPCTPVGSEIGVPIEIKKGESLGELIKWAQGVTCEEFGLDESESAEKLTVVMSGTIRAGDVRTLVVALASAANVTIGAKGCKHGLQKAAHRVDDHTIEIERAALTTALGNRNCVELSARVIPSMKKGKSEGFHLSQVRPESLYDMLGFQNGDVVLSVNGLALDNPEDAVAAFKKLKAESQVTFAIERKGAAAQVVWKIK